MRISDWSSDVCSSDLWYQPLSSPTILAVSPGRRRPRIAVAVEGPSRTRTALDTRELGTTSSAKTDVALRLKSKSSIAAKRLRVSIKFSPGPDSSDYVWRLRRSFPPSSIERSEEHTSELQSLLRTSYAVFCLKKKKLKHT